jgi:hypothetical protein
MLRGDLLTYWPRQEDVSACVKTDAEASSEAVSLAVHQPMTFERRMIGGESGSLPPCDENELLELFLTNNIPDGRVIVPIVGSSGTGKSHVIRWLDAQIRRMEGHDRRVVIRIPKGTSLKGVLGILLKDLRGPEYDEYRKELVRAQEELDPEEAAGLLCEMLAYTVGEMGVQAKQKLLTNPGDSDARERDAFCRADMLPALLRNQLLRDQHFVHMSGGRNGVVTRLVAQLTEERAAGIDDDRQHLFTAEDLIFPVSMDQEGLGRLELKAIAHLGREDRRETAVRILNQALDDAKQRLLRLDPTVSDLFNAVREQLLREGKELVLLVEDFAVLSGIQKQLLQVIIKEAFRDGRPVLCTMRTALAYTTGYMDTATVLTRANVEFRIPDEPGTEEDIHRRIERLIGAYLNAARCGQNRLEKAYGTLRSTGRSANAWVPHFSMAVEHDAQATLDEFGRSVEGYEYFPFNQLAIHELSREGCVQNGRLVYNPRFVIQNVINKVLSHRDLFEEGQFPSASFGSQTRPLPARVVEEVKRRVQTSQLDRYLKFLTYWGGFPGDLKDVVGLDARVYLAFGLDKAIFGRDPGPASSPPTRPKPDTLVRPREAAGGGDHRERDSLEIRWEKLLEGWRAGVSLPQSEANQLRKWIAEALKGSVDWDWELFRPLVEFELDRWFEWIYIPQAAGNQGRTAEEAVVAVCGDSDLADTNKSAGIQSAIMALIRFHGVNKCTWDYEDSDLDLPRYFSFLEGISDSARQFVRSRYFKAKWDPVPSLVQGLLIGARALGVESATADRNYKALIHSLFIPNTDSAVGRSPSREEQSDATGWTEFSSALRQCRRVGEKELRDQLSWQGHLLNLIGARQGQAETVHAIDVMRLKPALDETTTSWEFRESPPSAAGAPEFTSFKTMYVNLKKHSTAISRVQSQLLSWRKKTIAWLGADTDKEDLLHNIKDAIESAKAAGVASGLDTKKLLQLLEEFRNAKVMAALEDTEKLGPDASRGQVLTVLGRGHTSVARLCEEFQNHLESFLAPVEAELVNESLKYGEDPIGDALSTLTSELSELIAVLEGVEAR